MIGKLKEKIIFPSGIWRMVSRRSGIRNGYNDKPKKKNNNSSDNDDDDDDNEHNTQIMFKSAEEILSHVSRQATLIAFITLALSILNAREMETNERNHITYGHKIVSKEK